MWVIVIEFRNQDIPQVFGFSDERKASDAYDRLVTTKPYRITLWCPQFGCSDMHKLDCFENRD